MQGRAIQPQDCDGDPQEPNDGLDHTAAAKWTRNDSAGTSKGLQDGIEVEAIGFRRVAR